MTIVLQVCSKGFSDVLANTRSLVRWPGRSFHSCLATWEAMGTSEVYLPSEQAQWAVERRQILLVCTLEHHKRNASKHPHICTDVQSTMCQCSPLSPALGTHHFFFPLICPLHTTHQQLAEYVLLTISPSYATNSKKAGAVLCWSLLNPQLLEQSLT